MRVKTFEFIQLKRLKLNFGFERLDHGTEESLYLFEQNFQSSF